MTKKMIELRSDTFTRPTEGMLAAMFAAEVGDDVFGEDPTINQLQTKLAKILGKEAAIFTPSGTMANQIAIKLHTQAGDEVICDQSSHIYNFEAGGIAYHSGASVRMMHGDQGRFMADEVAQNINDPKNYHLPITRLVALENTTNKGGGAYYDFAEVLKIKEVCVKNGLKMHVDGARLFNALAETKQAPADFAAPFDSVSICLSKGLGTPVGSVLVGSSDFIYRARRVRKIFGGAMRQAGYLAAAGVYALDNHVVRLQDDHARAKKIEEIVSQLSIVKRVAPVNSNIVIFDLKKGMTSAEFLEKLKENGILGVSFGVQTVRLTTHLDFTKDNLDQFEQTIKRVFR